MSFEKSKIEEGKEMLKFEKDKVYVSVHKPRFPNIREVYGPFQSKYITSGDVYEFLSGLGLRYIEEIGWQGEDVQAVEFYGQWVGDTLNWLDTFVNASDIILSSDQIARSKLFSPKSP